MSLAIGVVSLSSKSMGHDEKNNEGEEHCEASKTKTTAKAATNEGHNDEHGHGHEHGGMLRQMSESSIYATDQDEEDEEGRKIELGPQYTLKEQFEKDKVCFCMVLCFFIDKVLGFRPFDYDFVCKFSYFMVFI
jgi:Rho GDP-dissociation inhibitor